MKILEHVAKSIGKQLIVNKLDKPIEVLDKMSKKEDEEEKLKEEFVKNGEQDDYNFEEEDD